MKTFGVCGFNCPFFPETYNAEFRSQSDLARHRLQRLKIDCLQLRPHNFKINGAAGSMDFLETASLSFYDKLQ